MSPLQLTVDRRRYGLFFLVAALSPLRGAAQECTICIEATRTTLEVRDPRLELNLENRSGFDCQVTYLRVEAPESLIPFFRSSQTDAINPVELVGAGSEKKSVTLEFSPVPPSAGVLTRLLFVPADLITLNVSGECPFSDTPPFGDTITLQVVAPWWVVLLGGALGVLITTFVLVPFFRWALGNVNLVPRLLAQTSYRRIAALGMVVVGMSVFFLRASPAGAGSPLTKMGLHANDFIEGFILGLMFMALVEVVLGILGFKHQE